MKLTKILSFNEEELAALTQAGKVLGALANKLKELREEAAPADNLELDEGTAKMVEALNEVISRIYC